MRTPPGKTRVMSAADIEKLTTDKMKPYSKVKVVTGEVWYELYTSRGREKPDAETIGGTCPVCGNIMVASGYCIVQRGRSIRQIIVRIYDCWGSLQQVPTCDYSFELLPRFILKMK